MKKTLVTTVFILLLSVSLSWAVTVTKWLLGSQTSLLTTEMNSLANNAFTAASAIYNNSVGGGGGDGYLMCDIEGTFTFAANPTAGTSVIVWFLMTQDGTNFENTPTASVTLGRSPDVVLPVTSGQTSTRVMRRIVCPWGNFKAVAKNDGTGQAMAASGNTLKIRPVTPEGV